MGRIALRQPLLSGLAAGKWDRFATFGEKVQEGQRFVFNDETLGQIVDNFARLYQGRRLGMDYEHQAMNAAQNGQPAPSLAYYNALCVIKDGQPVKFHAQKPDVTPPDPAALLAQLRERFPDLDSVDGLWGYRCEHTPMGAELLPNYEQISPLFTSDGTDEQERPVGYVLMNVAAVNVAFQDGTVFNLSKPGVTKMADEKKEKDEGEKPSALRAECLKAFGLPEDSSDDALYGAIKASKMGDLEIVHKEDEDEAKKVDDPAMGKMGMDDMPPAAMSKVLKRLEEAERAAEAAQQRAAALEATERQRAVATFKQTALSRLDTEKDADEWLADFGGDIDKATRALSRLPLKRTGVFTRMTSGGAPVGVDSLPPSGGIVESVNGVRVIGRGLATFAKKLVDEGKAKDIGEAQIMAAKQHPHLYQG